jgi:hypothetical protein
MPTIVPAPRKITPELAAELMRRRSEGARALEREFGISNQAIGKFFKREDAKGAAELEQANQQVRESPNADRHGDPTSPDRGHRDLSPTPAARLGVGGVPIFPNTPEGQAERFAYYEARKLNHLPHSLLDYHDVLHGRETPAERRAREGRTTDRRR